MADVSTDLLEMVLREIAATRGAPWYPSVYAQATGVPRDALDGVLDQLRLAGLVRLTDWEQGRGQGYTVTPEGQLVLDNPRLVARLREGREVPRPRLRTARTEERSLRGTGTHYDRAEAIRAALLSPARPVVTHILIWANVAVFALGLWLAMRQGEANAYLGTAQVNPVVHSIQHELGTLHRDDLTQNGQWWRLLSHCFVHLGLLHIILNMYGVYILGGLLEPIWGRTRFLAVYLISGLGGGVLQILMDPRPSMAGASGCWCGLLGSFAVWLVMNRSYLPSRLVASWSRSLTVNLFLLVFISMMPRVSWAGHLGGGLAGAVVSLPLVWSRYGVGGQRWLGWIGTAVVPLAALLLLYQSLAPAMDVAADDPELKQAREKYKPLLIGKDGVDAIGINTFDDHAARFLAGNEVPKADAEPTRNALAAAAKARDSLKKTAGELETLAPKFGNRAIRRHILLAREYALKLAAFYDAFATKLVAEGDWGARKADLNELWKAALVARRQLEGQFRELLLQ